MPRRIALSWEKNGPNYYTTIAEREISVCLNDITGRYHLACDGKDITTTYPTARAAKSAAERVAYEVYEEVS